MQYELAVLDAANFLRRYVDRPEFGVVLGSGLGDLAQEIENPVKIPYEEIPNFPITTVEGHEGVLYGGKIAGVKILGLKGRKHFYEVANQPDGMKQVVFPVHVLAELGTPNYFATNAAGGLNLDYSIADVMIINSHINLIPNVLLGPQDKFRRLDGAPTWRFQPMNAAYDPQYRELLRKAARSPREGVYLGLTGPTYETEAECIAFRRMGADAVGMSTTPEVIVARNRGMKCVGMSCITNKIAEDGTNATNHEEVKAILDAPETRERLSSTVRRFFELYKKL